MVPDVPSRPGQVGAPYCDVVQSPAAQSLAGFNDIVNETFKVGANAAAPDLSIHIHMAVQEREREREP